MKSSQVTVVIPTIGDERRAGTIWRAIESAGARSGVATRIIVVVNGPHFSTALIARLQRHDEVTVVQIAQGGLPLALKVGREQVTSEYFAFLDDDDELLPDGLKFKVESLAADPDLAFVASCGWLNRAGVDLAYCDLRAGDIELDPLSCLLKHNWLASASGLYRSTCVSAADFASVPPYLEWTYLGFRLASRQKFRFLDVPTFRVFDNSGSVSKSKDYQMGLTSAIETILKLKLPAHARNGLRRKLGAAHHGCADLELRFGNLGPAWRQHLRSLSLPGGMRYASFTRHLIWPRVLIDSNHPR